jgi:hypothetical protein
VNKITLRNQQLQESYFDCENASEVVGRIKSQMENEQKVICSMRLNDHIISEEQESTLIDYKLSNVHMLEIEYCEYEEFYKDFIQSTQLFVIDLKKLCPHISEAIYEQQMERFHNLFHDFIVSMDSMMSAVHFIHYKGRQEAAESTWKDVETSTSEVLRQILSLYPVKDFVSLADVFDYEMTDVLEEWAGLLQTISANEHRGDR